MFPFEGIIEAGCESVIRSEIKLIHKNSTCVLMKSVTTPLGYAFHANTRIPNTEKFLGSL